MKRNSFGVWTHVGALLLLLWSVHQQALACDLCAIYMATEQRESRTGVFAGIAEQYSDFETWQHGGEKVANPAGERMHSFITKIAEAIRSPRASRCRSTCRSSSGISAARRWTGSSTVMNPASAISRCWRAGRRTVM